MFSDKRVDRIENDLRDEVWGRKNANYELEQKIDLLMDYFGLEIKHQPEQQIIVRKEEKS